MTDGHDDDGLIEYNGFVFLIQTQKECILMPWAMYAIISLNG